MDALRKVSIVVLALVAAAPIAPATARAADLAPNAPIVVTTTDDVIDADDGALSLREAVNLASGQAGDDEIQLAAGEYVIDLGCEVPEPLGEEKPESGDLDHEGDGLAIVGPPIDNVAVLRAACEGGVHHRVLNHRSPGLLDLRGIEISNGRSDDGFGGGVAAAGDVHLTDVRFTDNAAGDWGNGGGLQATGDVTSTASTFTGNSAAFGGALRVGGSTTISGGRFADNVAEEGMGGALFGDTVTIDGAEFTGNTADSSGGAVLAERATISNSQFTGNTGGNGGGVSARMVTITDSEVSGNRATDFGGGVAGWEHAEVERTTVSGNAALHQGGGVMSEQVVLTDSVVTGNIVGPNVVQPEVVNGGGGVAGGYVFALRSTISDNEVRNGTSQASGGGVWAENLYMVASTVSGNHVAYGSGGGVAVLDLGDLDRPGITVFNSTLSGNSVADGSGGGLWSQRRGNAVISSTVVGNEAPTAANLDLRGEAVRSGIERSVIADPVGGSSCAEPVVLAVSSVDSDGSCSVAEPEGIYSAEGVVRDVDAQMGPLADNGGPTLTHRPEAGSPAIDLAEDGDGNDVDQRGVPRPQGPAHDAGSVEVVPDSITVTTTEDVIDPDDGLLSLREAVILASERTGDDEITVPAGTYALTLGCDVAEDDASVDPAAGKGRSGDLDHDGGALVLRGPSPDERATIVACESGRRILQHTSTSDLELDNLRLTGGDAGERGEGGAVRSVGSVVVTGSRLDGNTAGSGGAIHTTQDLMVEHSEADGNRGGNGGTAFAGWGLTILDSRFEGNEATSGGGGVAFVGGYIPGTNEDNPVIIRRSTFIGNVGGQGGVLDAQTNSPQNLIEDSTFRDNWAWTIGGALIVHDFRIERSEFTGNGTEYFGAVIDASDLEIDDSQFSDSYLRASFYPDARDYPLVLEVGGGTVDLNRVSFENGQLGPDAAIGTSTVAVGARGVTGRDVTIAGYPGGGPHTAALSASREGVALTNSTLSGNGGTAVQSWGPVVLDHSTVAGSGADGSASIVLRDDAELTVRRSIIDPAEGATGCATTATSFVDSIDADGSCSEPGSSGSLRIVDPQLGPLADNGGSTRTRLPAADSPAVDLVPASRCTEHGDDPSPLADQRGAARPVGPRCDAGAVELQPTEEPDVAFTDVPVDHWAGDAITWLVRRGVAIGYADGSFRPGRSVTRAQAVEWLWRGEGRPDAGAHGFDDVPPGFWAEGAVGWAGQSGIVNGFRDGTFRPGEAVTRVQFVRMLWQIAGSPDPGAASPFHDTPAWAADAVAWAAEHRIVTGYGDNSFRPGNTITRAAAARMLLGAATID